MTARVEDADSDDESQDEGEEQSTSRVVVDEWDEEEVCDLVTVPSCCRKLSEHLCLACSLIGAVLLLMAAAAWLGRLSAGSSSLPELTSVLSSHSSLTPTAADCPPRRPAAFMNLLHNTLLPDLSLSNQPYPVSTSRLPGGEVPALSVYYCSNAEWFQYILDDTLPDVFRNYTRVPTYDFNKRNLWILQAFAGDSHPVPAAINRAIGQRRLFITGEPHSFLDERDVDAFLDTKTSPFAHPPGAAYVYFPDVYAAHYDFIRAGQAKGAPPKYDLSLIKAPNYSQSTNFTSRRFMAYMQGHCVPYRDAFFDLVSQYKLVDAIGKCKHNVPASLEHRGPWWEGVQVYSQYKFAITLESTLVEGYITEKILGPMITGAIPIYLGSSDIGDHFNERAFIHVGRYSTLEKVMERIIYLDQNDTAYAEVLDEPWLVGNKPSMWMPHGNKESYLHQQFAALRDVLLHPNYTQRMNEGLPAWAKEQQGWKGRADVDYLRGR